MKLLLSGIPGGGKTTIARGLATAYRFTSVPMEEYNFELANQCLADPARFLAGLPSSNVVLDWGFDPFVARPAIEAIIAAGFKPFWFDGNRAHFYTSFMRRENGSLARERAYYMQLFTIIDTEIIDRFPWLQFDPFLEDGSFHPDNVNRLLATAAARQ